MIIDERQTRIIIATESHKIAMLVKCVIIMQARAIATKIILIIKVAINVFLEISIKIHSYFIYTNIITQLIPIFHIF